MSIYQKNNPKTIQKLFDSIAPRYDRANHLISLSLHKRWNRRFWNSVIGDTPPSSLLDLCCGTGETTLPYLRALKQPVRLTLLDFSVEMLLVAQKKEKMRGLSPHTIRYVHADAQKIPLLSTSIDCAMLAYGIRNIADPKRCLNDVFRVLRPGGRLGILELTRPKNRFLRWAHRIYLRLVLPSLGRVVTRNQQAYEYLSKSVEQFVEPEQLAKEIEEAGFSSVQILSVMGGFATIWLAAKKE